MRNLFFAFLLLGSFAFASHTGIGAMENDQTTLESGLLCGFDISWETDGPYGSGSSWFDCDGWSMEDIMSHILEAFF